MKIQGNQGSHGVPELQGARQADRARAESGVSVGREDSVKISSQAKDVQRVMAEIDKVPEVRTERVEELRSAIEAGTYNIRGEAVAEKMVRETLIDTIL